MIWFFALGYFLSYVPYSALVKGLSSGLIPGMHGGLDGTSLLPVTALTSMVGMLAFLTAMRWWRYAGHRQILGLSLPCPSLWTFLSGLCTATIILTTTLAYTFSGVSIVLMMLLLRGGVLVIAPIVDALSHRHVRWFSWIALVLSMGSVLVGFTGGDTRITAAAALNVAAYIGSYFVRLRFMSHQAKAEDPNASTRYFVEEQMTATAAAVIGTGAIALFGHGAAAQHLRDGFAMLQGHAQLGLIVLAGLCSQGTGIFGGLVLLDKRENSFCVPVNRASSMLAGLVAELSVALLGTSKWPASREYLGAGMVIAAILVLSLPGVLKKRVAPAPAAPTAAPR
jgi:hypothetical protein